MTYFPNLNWVLEFSTVIWGKASSIHSTHWLWRKKREMSLREHCWHAQWQELALRVTLACLTCAHWRGERSIAPGAPDLFPRHARKVGHWGAMLCSVALGWNSLISPRNEEGCWGPLSSVARNRLILTQNSLPRLGYGVTLSAIWAQ